VIGAVLPQGVVVAVQVSDQTANVSLGASLPGSVGEAFEDQALGNDVFSNSSQAVKVILLFSGCAFQALVFQQVFSILDL
jgi:hypothetical protein